MCVDPWWCHSWKGFNSSMRKVGGPVILRTYWWMAYVDVHSYSQKRFSWFSLKRATTAHESSIQNLFKSDHHSLLPKHLVCRHSMAGCGGFVIWIRQYEFLSTARSLPLLRHSSYPLLGGAQAQTCQWFEIFVNIFGAAYFWMSFPSKQSSTTVPDPYKTFSEKLNGRAAMLGLVIGLAVEALTGKGILEQIWTFNRASVLDLSPLTTLLSGIFSWCSHFGTGDRPQGTNRTGMKEQPKRIDKNIDSIKENKVPCVCS